MALLADSLGGLAQTALIVLALAGVATGGIASMSLFRVKEGRLLEDWMTARARAETKRLSYFSYIVNSSVQPLDLQLELLKLEYFRRSARLLQDPSFGPPQLGRTDPEHLSRIRLGGGNCLRSGWGTRCREERMGCARFARGVRRRAPSVRRCP